MDLDALNRQMNDAVNCWVNAAKDYFGDLNQMELYGWSAFGLGFLVFIVGIVLL